MPLPDGYVVPKRQMQEFEVFDEGLYNVKIDKIVLKKDVPSFNDPEDKHDALTFHFKILDPGKFLGHIMFKGSVRILMAAGWDGGQASTLYKIYCAANKVKLSDDDAQLVTASEINALEGKVLSVLVENKPNSKGIIGSKITNYVASRGAEPQSTGSVLGNVEKANDTFAADLEAAAAQNAAVPTTLPNTEEINVDDIPF